MSATPPDPTRYTPPAATGEDPGKGLGIAGLVLSILSCTGLIGLILSIVAFRKSKAAGFRNTIALVGIVIGIITTIGTVIAAISLGVGAYALVQACQQLGPGVHQQGGTTITCG